MSHLATGLLHAPVMGAGGPVARAHLAGKSRPTLFCAPVAGTRRRLAAAARRPARRRRCTAAQARVGGDQQMVTERSALVNKEVVLFLFQLELDQQLQRALNYDDLEAVQEIRARRTQVDEALKELSSSKGPGCGARLASKSDQVDLAPAILRLRLEMQQAVDQERYADAASLRDQLKPLEEQSRAAAAQWQCLATEPRFKLGQVVVHASKGYRAVVCGWDGTCCEDEEWQAQAGVSTPRQVFYHLLVDVRDWPTDEEQPPVAYVAEDSLSAASHTDFSLSAPLNGAGLFHHPYSYLLFLGPDGKGNMLPCRQLRDKYCVERQDVYSPGEGESSDEDDEDLGRGGGGGSKTDGGNDGGNPRGSGGRGGGFKIPGIDMSSLED